MLHRALALTLLVALPMAQALAEDLPCPADIETDQALKGSTESGWAPFVTPAHHYLAGVSLFDGEPAANVRIAPTRDFKSGAKRVAVWQLGASGAPVWLACRYQGTNVQLVRPLPLSYKQCQGEYRDGSNLQQLTCR